MAVIKTQFTLRLSPIDHAKIKKICKKHKMTEAWKSRYYAFLEKHKRKPLLMGYIQSEKALPS